MHCHSNKPQLMISSPGAQMPCCSWAQSRPLGPLHQYRHEPGGFPDFCPPRVKPKAQPRLLILSQNSFWGETHRLIQGIQSGWHEHRMTQALTASFTATSPWHTSSSSATSPKCFSVLSPTLLNSERQCKCPPYSITHFTEKNFSIETHWELRPGGS